MRTEALLRQAVERDPGFADAWGALTDCRGRLMVGGWTNDWDADAARNREAALQAVQCDPDDGVVLSIAAWSLISLSSVLDKPSRLRARSVSSANSSMRFELRVGAGLQR